MRRVILAAGLINVLAQQGISVPAEIAVMGCDHNSSAPDANMTVSTVSARGFEMGATAMSLLVDELFYQPPRSYEEVSQRTGLPVGSIGPTRIRTLRRLHRTLRDPECLTARAS